MSTGATSLALTVRAMRPMVPTKGFGQAGDSSRSHQTKNLTDATDACGARIGNFSQIQVRIVKT